MKRLLAFSIALLPFAAHAQSDVHADVQARAEYTDNARLVTESGSKDADQILVANPSVEGVVDTRGVKAEIAYALSYYHYQKNDDLDRALHDLHAKAALMYWDAVDLDAAQILRAEPLSYARPLTDPVNDVQQSRSQGHAGFHHEFGPSTRASLGGRGEYVTYFKVNKADSLPPGYTTYGPELSAERDLGPRATLGVMYAYRVMSFASVKAGALQPLDYQAHVGELSLKATPTDWLAIEAAGGGKSVTFEDKSNKTRATGRLAAVAGGEIGRVDLTASQDVTQDIIGNAATITRATLGGSYEPTAPWSARATVGYGSLQYLFPPDTTGVKTTQSFLEGSAAFAYRISVGTLTLGVAHNESTTTVASLSGTAKVVVNRGFLELGGKF